MRVMLTYIVFFKFYFCNLFCGVFFKTLTYLWWTWGGCGIVLNFGGSFSDFTVFFIYLGGMLVVFGYMTATEQYPAV